MRSLFEGGEQTYRYVGNPCGWVDPLGLATCPLIRKQVLANLEASRAARRLLILVNSKRGINFKLGMQGNLLQEQRQEGRGKHISLIMVL